MLRRTCNPAIVHCQFQSSTVLKYRHSRSALWNRAWFAPCSLFPRLGRSRPCSPCLRSPNPPSTYSTSYVPPISCKVLVYGFSVNLIMHYQGQNPFAHVTEGQFIDYRPNYASVFFGGFLPP